MTKEKLIISRANTFRNEIQADVTVSAINNFSIIGTNLLKNTNIIEKKKKMKIQYHIEYVLYMEKVIIMSYLMKMYLIYIKKMRLLWW